MNKETPTVKEKAIYQAVVDLFMEGEDLSGLTVSEITAKAGIGKGTAYGYFSDKEEMIARSICYNVEHSIVTGSIRGSQNRKHCMKR